MRAMEQSTAESATAEVVASEPRVIEPARPAGQIVTQAAAVAATTFVAGAGLAAVIRGRRARGSLLPRRRRRVPIVATRSFLIDVHVLGTRR
jgi:predicted phage tail protein